MYSQPGQAYAQPMQPSGQAVYSYQPTQGAGNPQQLTAQKTVIQPAQQPVVQQQTAAQQALKQPQALQQQQTMQQQAMLRQQAMQQQQAMLQQQAQQQQQAPRPGMPQQLGAHRK